jgi:Zn-dependent protease/CBS domain-containing protein
MGWSIMVGRIAGTAVRIHITFLLFLLWIGFSSWRTGGSEQAWNGILFMVLLFACVLAHEFGHIFMARRFGIATPDVTLLPIGGVAQLERLPEKPWEQLWVAIAGPAVNVVIALVLIFVMGAATDVQQLAQIEDARVTLVARLASANLFLAVFNLLPAYPMDGGRVLNAILAMRMDPRRAIQISARIGQGFALLLGFLGLFGNPLLVFIAIFIYMAAASEAQGSTMQATTSGLAVSDAMETKFATIPIDATLAAAVDALLASSQHEFPVVDAFGKPMGVLTRDRLLDALRTKAPETSVADALDTGAPSVRPRDPLDAAMQTLSRLGAPAISVVDEDGRTVGMLTMQNIVEMMLIKSIKPEWQFGRKG